VGVLPEHLHRELNKHFDAYPHLQWIVRLVNIFISIFILSTCVY
jgi:hypothetical protein